MSTASSSAGYYERNRDLVSLRAKHKRRANVAWCILEDTRKEDRKRDRENDLDMEFVTGLVGVPCSYCGDESLHTKSNVVAACERCNIVRRDMPYAAWLVVSAGMREARVRGLFGTWEGALHRRPPLPPLPVTAAKSPVKHGTMAGYNRCRPVRCAACKMAMRDWQRGQRAKRKPAL